MITRQMRTADGGLVSSVAVTNHGNHTPHDWANLCVDQIMRKAVAVSDGRDGLPERAIDRERVRGIIENYITMALEAETLAGQSIMRRA